MSQHDARDSRTGRDSTRNMQVIMVNGFSGSGKSTIARQLQALGETAISCDGDPDLAVWVHADTGQPVIRPDTPTADWIASHQWTWIPQRLDEILAAHRATGDARLWLCGNAANARDLRDRFDLVILLYVDLAAMLARLDNDNRGNDWGRVGDTRTDLIAAHADWHERESSWADITIDATRSLDTVIGQLIETATDHLPLRRSAPDGTGFEALIFDWDGTLVDSRDICFQGLAGALAEVGVLLDPEWYWPRQAIASPDMLVQWEIDYGRRLPAPIDDIIDRCRTLVIAAAPRLQLIEPYVSIAQAAHQRGQKLAIGSNASTTTVAAGLSATGLDSIFSTVVTWSDVPAGRGKPAPDIFLRAAVLLDVAPVNCLVYEDADAGIAAATAAGMASYNVTTRRLRTAHPVAPTRR